MPVNGASSTAKTIAMALLFTLLLVPSAWFAWENRHMPQFGQAHDDAIYYIAAKSLADGQGYRIASLPQAPYETKYPPMLPWLLSIAWIVQPRFPENLAIATAIQWAMIPPFLWLCAAWFRRMGFSPAWRWSALAILALQPYTVMFAAGIFTETLYAGFLLGSLLACEQVRQRVNGLRWAALAGILAGLGYMARSAGIVALVSIPAVLRARAGAPAIAPDPNLPLAADVLRMLHGAPADAAQAQLLDTYLAVMAESGMGPATFTARTVASTRASLTSAVLAAWCSFTGPLHGGAPGPTLDVLDAAAAAAHDLDAWLEQKLKAGERIAGFGHRVFRGNDPRAAALRAALERMGSSAGRLQFAAHLEARLAAVLERIKPGRRLPANVEIMAALLLDAVGIPREAFTAIFAISRRVRAPWACCSMPGKLRVSSAT